MINGLQLRLALSIALLNGSVAVGV